MNVLMLGWAKHPGSWTIRGLQIAPALNALAVSDPTPADWRWADVACMVKRSEPRYGPMARSLGLPIVWDALDFWKQPTENGLTEAEARAALHRQIDAIRPVLTIGATRTMAAHAGGRYLPHHSWPGLEPADARPTMKTVAYQGNPAYLGHWMERLTHVCLAHGWTFEINPADLRTADVLVAFRDGPWDGWACRHWKSGVKLVNAIAAGRPILTQHTAAAEEIGPPGSIVESVEDLHQALQAWRDPLVRQAAAETCATLAPAYQLAAVAQSYRALLQEVVVHA